MIARGEDRHDAGPCPAQEEIVALVMDGPDAGRVASLQVHIDRCTDCQRLVGDVREARTALASGAASAAVDLVPGVLARLPENAWQERGRMIRFPLHVTVCAAAALLILLVGGLLVHRNVQSAGPRGEDIVTGDSAAVLEPKQVAFDTAVSWLVQRQQATGDWDVRALGGNSQYIPALNGLAALALAETGAQTPAHREALVRSGGFLVAQQADSGRFGEAVDGTMYNHGIATLALLKVYSLSDDTALRGPIGKALAFVREQQSRAGGWGYRQSDSGQPNTSITAWQVQALLLGDELGWRDNRQTLRRAVAWLSATMDGRGHFGYERPQQFPEGPNTLTMMGAFCLLSAERHDIRVGSRVRAQVRRGMTTLAQKNPGDYYATFFYSSALSEDTQLFQKALAVVTASVVSRQVSAEADLGTWRSSGDRWGSAGGELYSTSMAMLSLRPGHRPAL